MKNMRDKYFTNEQIDKIYSVIDADKNNAKYLILELIAITGARGDEIMRCKFADLDTSKWRLTIRHASKNSESRTCAIGEDIGGRLIEMRDMRGLSSRDTLQLLVSRGTKATALRELRRVFDCIQAKLWPGQIAPGLHGLRHTKARRAYELTKDIYMVQAVLGHRCLSSTARYMPKVDENTLTEIQLRRK